MTGGRTAGGRALSGFVDRIMGEIGSGRYQRGGFLPSTRALAALYDTSPETARRGLNALQGEGVLISEGRSGFRVAQPGDNRASQPVAFVTKGKVGLPHAQHSTAALFLAFQSSGADRGWPFLGAHAGDGGVNAITSQLRTSNTWGIILDTINKDLYAAVVRCGLPTVMVNSWVEDSPVSAVLQDNYRGGFLAAEYLVRQGARRISWIGPVSAFCHSRERFAGASACLRAEGVRLDERDCIEARGKIAPADMAALLDRSDRPEGILALGVGSARTVKAAADERGLVVGRDFEMVSWVTEECYDQAYLPVFRGGAPAPAVVWSAATMADRALALLSEIGDGLIRQPVRLCVPTRLRLDGGVER